MRPEVQATFEGFRDRAKDRRMRMAIDSGGELAEEIDVFVPVEVPQPRLLAAHHRQRKRVDMDRRARVAPRHRRARRAMLGEALRVASPIKLLGLHQCGCDVDAA